MSALNASSQPSGQPAPKRGRFLGLWFVAGAVLLLALLAATAVVERKPVAALLVQSYLARHGVASTVEFDRLSRGGFLARVRVGEEMPEFSADILDVTLSYDGIFALPTLGTVRLVRPVLRAGYDGTKLSFGSLQPLVDEALAKEPEGPGPSVTVEGGTLFMSTPDGVLQFAVDGAIAQGALTSLTGKLSPVALHGPMYDADIAGAVFSAKLVNGALDGSGEITLRSAKLKENAGGEASGIVLTAEAKGMQWRKNGGDIAFTATGGTIGARSAILQSADVTLADGESRVVFQKLSGTYADAKLSGTAEIDLIGNAGAVRMPARSASKPSLHAAWANADFDFAPDAWSVGGMLHLVLDAQETREALAKGEIALRSVHGDFSGDTKITNTSANGTMQGSLAGAAVVPGPVARDFVAALPVISIDPALPEALVRAMSNVDVKLPRVRVVRSDGQTSLALLAEASLSGPDAARLTVSPEANRPLFALRDGAMDGAFGTRLSGGNLPELELAVSSYRANWSAREFVWNASTRLETRLDLAAFHGVYVRGVGEIASRDGRLTVALPQCADVDVALYRGDKGALLSGAKAQLCADAERPLVVSDKNGWQFASSVRGASAQLVQAQSVLTEGAGRFMLAGDADGPRAGRLETNRATVTDLLPTVRFRPVNLDGAMDLTGQDWSGTLAVGTKGKKLASVAVRHNMRSGSGTAAIEAHEIAFDPGNFQPGDISPLLAGFATRVRGGANFDGQVRWTTEELETSGHVQLANVDFQSRLGGVRQTRGEIVLTSLMPVTLAPHQTLTMDRIDWLVPLELAKVQFSLTPSEITLDAASANIASGRVSLDPERFLFDPKSTTQGTLHLEHVDPSPLLTAAGLSDRIKIQARVQGTVPFTYGPAGLRFANGRVAAEGPGRLSVQREALTEAVGTGGTGAGQSAAVQDFAYQALENLSFDQLTGDVNSLPQGRLGVLLHVKGVHDPAEAAEVRVGVTDLLQGRAFDKPLPLPKGTPIDLTLDTSLNLDELLGSYFGTSGNAAMAAP